MRAGYVSEVENKVVRMEGTMRYIIDRIEEGIVAVCEKEDGSFEEISVASFGFEVSEGDCIIFDEETGYKKDEKRKGEIQREVDNLMDDLFS